MPFIDAVVISHSHYVSAAIGSWSYAYADSTLRWQDHLDIHTLKALQAKQAKDKDSRPIRLFVPLGNKKWAVSNLGSLGAENIIELDWWEGTSLTRGDEILKIQCTPAQHFVRHSYLLIDLLLKKATVWAHPDGPQLLPLGILAIHLLFSLREEDPLLRWRYRVSSRPRFDMQA